MYYTYAEMPMGTVLLTKDGDTITGIHWKIFRRAPLPASDWIENKTVFTELLSQLDEYYTGKRNAFDIKFAAKGTPFQMSVWKELEKIRFGESSSYQARSSGYWQTKRRSCRWYSRWK